ncbi:MAG: hypothetical protein JXR68_12155 [Bacteroidales bacterium]|nr:hypothetical protein [Bacteroidales bacterium]
MSKLLKNELKKVLAKDAKDIQEMYNYLADNENLKKAKVFYSYGSSKIIIKHFIFKRFAKFYVFVNANEFEIIEIIIHEFTHHYLFQKFGNADGEHSDIFKAYNHLFKIQYKDILQAFIIKENERKI